MVSLLMILRSTASPTVISSGSASSARVRGATVGGKREQEERGMAGLPFWVRCECRRRTWSFTDANFGCDLSFGLTKCSISASVNSL
jgi:hypothetical protein